MCPFHFGLLYRFPPFSSLYGRKFELQGPLKDLDHGAPYASSSACFPPVAHPSHTSLLIFTADTPPMLQLLHLSKFRLPSKQLLTLPNKGQMHLAELRGSFYSRGLKHYPPPRNPPLLNNHQNPYLPSRETSIRITLNSLPLYTLPFTLTPTFIPASSTGTLDP